MASHPYSSALERDQRLGLSRYDGVQIRRRLTEFGFVHRHHVVTGRRSGKATLLELTSVGREVLKAQGIPVERSPHGPDFPRGYYAHRLAEYARRTWPSALVECRWERGASDHSPDVAVLIPQGGSSDGAESIAFEVVFAVAANDLRPRLQNAETFDQAIFCADTAKTVGQLRDAAQALVPSELLERVTFASTSAFLSVAAEAASHADAPNGFSVRHRASDGSRPAGALLRQVIEAYSHLHDLDWLQESPLTKLGAVRERTNVLAPMPEAQALRGLLVDAAQRAASHARDVPSQARLHVFLERYVEGKRVAEIAAELGVTREWCSRAYRRQALRLAGMQFVRLSAAA